MVTKRLDFDIIANDKASAKFDAVGKSAQGAGGKMKKFAAVGALAVGAAAVVAGKALFDMTMAASQDAAGQARLAKTLQNTTKATKDQVAGVEDWISRQGELLGVTDDQLRPAIEKLAVATGDLRQAQDLASLAMDVAAGSGKSLEQVSMALARAANGNVGALGRLGIATKDASGKTKDFDQITADLAKTFAGQARSQAETLEGKMARLRLRFDETKEAIGARLLPMAERFGTWMLDKAIPAIEQGAKWLGDKLGPAFEAVGDFISGILPALRDFAGKYLTGAKKAMADVKVGLKDAAPFFDLVKNVAKGVGQVLKTVVIPAMGWLVEKTFPLLGAAAKQMGKNLRAIGEAGKWMWNNALQPVFKLLFEAVSTSMRKFGEMLQTLGKAPGMGWVGDLGDKLVNTAEKADRVANAIRKIPDKTVNVHVRYTTSGRPPSQDPMGELPDRTPRATGRASGGFGVGPAGRMTARGGDSGGVSLDTLRAFFDGLRIEVTGPDAGMQAYLRTGAY